jgi:hypothetical protein
MELCCWIHCRRWSQTTSAVHLVTLLSSVTSAGCSEIAVQNKTHFMGSFWRLLDKVMKFWHVGGVLRETHTKHTERLVTSLPHNPGMCHFKKKVENDLVFILLGEFCFKHFSLTIIHFWNLMIYFNHIRHIWKSIIMVFIILLLMWINLIVTLGLL